MLQFFRGRRTAYSSELTGPCGISTAHACAHMHLVLSEQKVVRLPTFGLTGRQCIADQRPACSRIKNYGHRGNIKRIFWRPVALDKIVQCALRI